MKKLKFSILLPFLISFSHFGPLDYVQAQSVSKKYNTFQNSQWMLAHAGSVGVVKLRMKSMKVIGAEIKIIGKMLRGKIPFDGSYPQQNFYLGLTLNKARGLCTPDIFIGDWELIFRGTNYESIKFEVLDQFIPGQEDNYKPVC